MCGLTGFLHPQLSASSEVLRDVVLHMTQALKHRGPDDSGAWSDASVGLAIGHRRLAIHDLSVAGHQPMHSTSGRWVISFNGEIYNHLALRIELEAFGVAPIWRGHSDTETLLAGFECWGIEGTLQRCVGMFAIALWDRKTHTLTLARDRLGEKPLYYGWVGQGKQCAFVFGSELKALKAHSSFDAPICRQALAQYLRFMYVPAPRSIYQGIYKLEPGCLLSITGSPPIQMPIQPVRPGENHGNLQVKRWWSLVSTVEIGAGNIKTDEVEALRILEKQLIETVSLQSLADVPLGAFLSGGVDSSTIVALLQRQSSRPIKTFTIGFDEVGFDESRHALAIARHLGTEHHEMRVNAQIAQEVIPQLPHIYDEPFADSSQIPTYLLCQAARQHVTVVLSGDAGDELFGGYNRYLWGPKIWNKVAWLPMPARQVMGKLLKSLSTHSWDAMGKSFGMAYGNDGVSRLGDKLHRLGACMQTAYSMDSLYRSLVSEWQDPASLMHGISGLILEPPSRLDDPLPIAGIDDNSLRMMFLDTITYLPDDILCKVDRAAMACSLEVRVPFLDHRIVEMAWHLPLSMKIRGNVGKWAMRQVLDKHVPRKLIERPKAGFAIPIGQWLRGPLRAWAEDLLSEHRLQSEGLFHAGPLRKAWFEHLTGQRDNTGKLWAVLMFQAWLKATH